MKKLKLLIPALGLLPLKSFAICPVCTVGVAAGLGLSRWLKIDDTISGLWIGALTVSLILWTLNWLSKKNWRFPSDAIVTTLAYYILIIGSLYWANVIHPLNKLWGVDKLLLGTTLGSLIFALFAWLYQFMKKRNGGHAHFPFEKVVLVIAPLIVASFAFYFITKI